MEIFEGMFSLVGGKWGLSNAKSLRDIFNDVSFTLSSTFQPGGVSILLCCF